MRGDPDRGCHGRQEDLTFAYWRPSTGATRFTAILSQLVLPAPTERVLNDNLAFTSDYLSRVLATVPLGCGVALLHSHLGPGWQDMSRDDVVTETGPARVSGRRPYRSTPTRPDVGHRRHVERPSGH